MKFWILYSIALPLMICNGYSRATNIKCEVLDKSLVEIFICRLKVIGRGKVSVNLQWQWKPPPVKKIIVNLSVFKKLNGYHPFLINVTFDFCHYMKHPNPLNAFFYFHLAIKPFSNLNHTCPYTEIHILKDFVMTDEMFAKVPFPQGSYMFNVGLSPNTIRALNIRAYLDVDVDQTLPKHSHVEHK